MLKRHSPFETSFFFHFGRTLESEANVRSAETPLYLSPRLSVKKTIRMTVAYCGVSAFTTRVVLVGFGVFVMKLLEIRSWLLGVCVRLFAFDR